MRGIHREQRGTPAQSETPLPECTPEDSSAGNQPCWHVAIDAATCPNNDHFTLKIEGWAMLPGDARVVASCPIQPTH